MRKRSGFMADSDGSEWSSLTPEIIGETISFLALPGDIFFYIRKELGENAGPALFRMGYSCAVSLAKKGGVECEDEELVQTLFDHLMEIGFGRLKIERGKEKFSIVCEESAEAMALGNTGKKVCDFTRGYIAGSLSAFTGKNYSCTEEQCASEGKGHCLFLLVPKG